jgi:hypothetical protein
VGEALTKDKKSLAGCLEGMVAYERCREETANGQRMRIEEVVGGGDCGVALSPLLVVVR